MKLLTEYEILNTVFYRGIPVLKYIANNPTMSELDREAIQSTIMNALVYKKCIDETKEFLNFEALAITNNEEDYHYEEYPFVTGYPLWLKEEMRKHVIRWSGSIPVSVHAARPSGRVTYCIYDANTVLSIFFDDFAFIEANYDSPTRTGVRVERRPFLEVKMGEKMYLVDALTKRFFEEEEFNRRYQLEVTYRIKNKDFNAEQKARYQEQTEETDGYGSFLAFTIPMLETFKSSPKFEEYLYEVEESKKYFPEAWEDARDMMEECRIFLDRQQDTKRFVKGKKEEM